jgi:aryl carrier-like protein
MSALGGRLVEEQVRVVLAQYREIDLDANFFEAGFSSVVLAQALDGLRSAGFSVVLVDLYRYPTTRALAAELHRRAATPRAPSGGVDGGLPWAGMTSSRLKQ